MSRPTLPSVRPAFRALAATLCPEAEGFDEAHWRAAEAIVERALAARPPAVRRQLRVFIRASAGVLPLLRYGRPFARLDVGRREAWLRALERAPLLLVRRGVWGLRTLVFMGVYGQPDVRARIGFRGHVDGWDRQREGAS